MQALATSLAGLLTQTKVLDNISNNVANMNTLSFRRSDVFSQAVFGSNGQGIGSQLSQQVLSTVPGEFTQTDQPLDLAITGLGYFVLKDGDNLYYTRAGQFQIGEDNYIVDRLTGYRVQGLDDNGLLVDLNVKEFLNFATEPTTQINFSGNLQFRTNGNTDTTNEVEVQNVRYINEIGEEINLKVKFVEQEDTRDWQVVVTTEDDFPLYEGDLDFFGGTLSEDQLRQTFTIPASRNGEAGVEATITLNFSDEGKTTGGVTSEVGRPSAVTASLEDGIKPGGSTGLLVNEKGIIEFEYSNEETKKGPQVGLAYIADETTLAQASGNLLIATTNTVVTYGNPSDDIFGKIESQTIESSNVELATEFGNMIRTQRAYQGCSRIMNVVDEMLQDLVRGR